MALRTTEAGGPLTRVFFGSSRVGSSRGRVRTVRGLKGRYFKVYSVVASSARRFLRGNFTMAFTELGLINFTVTFTGMGLTGLRGRRSGNRGIILEAELGRRVTTTVSKVLLN